MKNNRLITLATLVLAWGGIGTLGSAQIVSENIEGFTVTGKGLVMAKPNLVEVDLEVSAASELTADAIVKYRDAKRRIHDAFAGLKLANLSLEERGLLLDQKGMQNMNYYFGGYQPNSRTKTEVQLSRKLVLKFSDIRKMEEDKLIQQIGKLLDVAQDAGAKVGKTNDYNPYYYDYSSRFNQGLVKFVVDDLDTLQEAAYEKAIADARTRAQRLARLSGVTLGPVVSAREVSVPGDRPSPNYNYYPGNTDDENLPKRLEASKFQEIPVRVELLVRFEIVPASAGKERAGVEKK